jgi:uncharacterized membrane protein
MARKYPVITRTLLILMIVFYLFAGYNHFVNPTFYYPIIPPYLSNWLAPINILAGIAEIVLAILLIPKSTRKTAAWGIIFMLIAFIPSHIYFIQKGSFQLGSLMVTPLVAWIRLLVIHPLLILWAWVVIKTVPTNLAPVL